MTTVFHVIQKGVDHEVLIDDEDADLLKYKWYINYRRGGVSGVHRNIAAHENKNKQTRMHRVIMERVLKQPLQSLEFVDHIDLNTLNNQRSNLRIATRPQNGANRRVSVINKLGVKGVREITTRYGFVGYNARITVNKQCFNLGTFPTIEEARQAYIAAAKRCHGEFARWE